MVTDSGDITDQSFNQTTYEAGRDYCKAHDIDFTYKKPDGDTDYARTAMVDVAVAEGYNIIILPGYIFAPTAVLTVQEIEELMQIMKGLAAEGKSILFITHKLNEIMEAADRCTILRKGRYIDTVDIKDTTPQKLSAMMVGRNVSFEVEKSPSVPGEVVLEVKNMSVAGEYNKKDAVRNVSFQVRKGEIVCIAGIDGNGQNELVYGLSGLSDLKSGQIFLNGQDVTKSSVRQRSVLGESHIP